MTKGFLLLDNGIFKNFTLLEKYDYVLKGYKMVTTVIRETDGLTFESVKLRKDMQYFKTVQENSGRLYLG